MVENGSQTMMMNDFVERYLPIELEQSNVNPMDNFVLNITKQRLNEISSYKQKT
jgi:hypothetical protein